MRSRRISGVALALLLILVVGAAYWLINLSASDAQSELALADFGFMHRQTRLDEVLDRLGEPSRQLGSGITRYQYDLADGRTVELIFEHGPLQAWILGHDGTSQDYFEVAGEAETCKKTESVEAIPDLVLSLESSDPVARGEAAKTLGCIGPEAAEAIPALTRTLGDEKRWVRSAAAWALAQNGSEAIPSLAQALESQDPNTRAAAAWGLGFAGQKSEVAIPNLIETLGDEDESVRVAAEWALGQIGSAAVPTLIQILEDEARDAGLRKSAAIALGHAGDEAEEAIPHLILALEDESEEVRTGSTIALWYITGHPVTDVDWWKEWWESQ